MIYTTYLVPLKFPCFGSKFQGSITVNPFFKLMMWSGKSELRAVVLSISTGYHRSFSFSFLPYMDSALLNCINSPGIYVPTMELIFCEPQVTSLNNNNVTALYTCEDGTAEAVDIWFKRDWRNVCNSFFFVTWEKSFTKIQKLSWRNRACPRQLWNSFEGYVSHTCFENHNVRKCRKVKISWHIHEQSTHVN